MQDSRDIENYINNELSAIGFPALDFNNTRETLGSIFSLLKQRQVIELNQRDIAYRQELQQRIQMVDQEHVQLETKLSKIKKQMEIKTKELGELQSKFTTSESQAKIKQRLANEKLEELRKAKSSLSHLRKQFENETRKFNKEKERLNSKVARLVSDPTKQALTFAMTGPLETVEPSNQTVTDAK